MGLRSRNGAFLLERVLLVAGPSGVRNSGRRHLSIRARASPRTNTTPFVVRNMAADTVRRASTLSRKLFFPSSRENLGTAAGAHLCAESGGAIQQPARRQRQLVGGSGHCFSPNVPAPEKSGCRQFPNPWFWCPQGAGAFQGLSTDLGSDTGLPQNLIFWKPVC